MELTSWFAGYKKKRPGNGKNGRAGSPFLKESWAGYMSCSVAVVQLAVINLTFLFNVWTLDVLEFLFAASTLSALTGLFLRNRNKKLCLWALAIQLAYVLFLAVIFVTGWMINPKP
ncbi:hypothetical protein ACI48J_11625 [Paenibacillus chitinolyticus]|uniref:hypothetical protein n=1 Tax=Paenibacillus chitinolyticus TaxID=79263 RepID=UPI00386CB53C